MAAFKICLQKGATVCFVIGDSAPYGVYVPVDEWLGRLAVAAGFKEFYFEKTRDRNVKWKDINGNTHKLDIVIECEGSEIKLGKPRTFIEITWHRYTKHSKNKVQEISAAIKPLVSRYSESSPFYGAVLAGEFTTNSMNHMKSEGFQLLYFPINAIEKAFASHGLNVHWNENTSEQEFKM